MLTAAPGFGDVFPGLKDLRDVFAQPTLNEFAALGRSVHRQVRRSIQELLSQDSEHASFLRDNSELRTRALLPQPSVRMHLPMAIGDYTDFYAGYHHAHAVGTMFRGPQNACNRTTCTSGRLPMAVPRASWCQARQFAGPGARSSSTQQLSPKRPPRHHRGDSISSSSSAASSRRGTGWASRSL